MVFVSLLTHDLWDLSWKEEDGHHVLIAPPLKCIISAFNRGEKNGHLGGHVADLQQAEMDRDLADWKAKTPAEYARLWDKLISPMLRVDYTQRFSSAEALQKLEELTSL